MEQIIDGFQFNKIMALIFSDGFDYYNSLGSKWDSVGGTFSIGGVDRTGNKCMVAGTSWYYGGNIYFTSSIATFNNVTRSLNYIGKSNWNDAGYQGYFSEVGTIYQYLSSKYESLTNNIQIGQELAEILVSVNKTHDYKLIPIIN